MRIFILVGLFFLAHQSIGQNWSFERWHEGKMFLDSGDTLRGKIKYDINSDIIQLDQYGHLQSFTARKIIFYEIWDESVSRYRQFYSIPFSATGGYKTPTFFELLAEGKLTLLSREALEYQTRSIGYYGMGSYSRLVLVNKYFILNDKGQIETFNGKRNDLLSLMTKRDDEIKRYIKSNRIDLDYKYDLARVFTYYNTLVSPNKP